MKLVDVRPDFPDGHNGTTPIVVQLDATIDHDGTVQDVHGIDPGAADFERAAIAAVRQWVFTPTYLDCDPIAVAMHVTVTFKPEP
jgi:TonB family protein